MLRVLAEKSIDKHHSLYLCFIRGANGSIQKYRFTVVKICIFTLIYRALHGITAGFIPANIVKTKKICDAMMLSSLPCGGLRLSAQTLLGKFSCIPKLKYSLKIFMLVLSPSHEERLRRMLQSYLEFSRNILPING